MRVCPKCYELYGPDTESCPVDSEPTERFEDLLIGRTLGPYVIQSILGEGGMGVVYKGEHPTIGRTVALKVLRPELSLRDNIVTQFVQEARSVNTIGHSNIVNIYDFGKTPFGSFYIVMEYLDGGTIRALVDQQQVLPLKLVRTVVRGVGAALAAAHAKGFVHRDVKPENIMLVQQRGKDFVKLLDFGIVKLLTDPSDSSKTLVGGALGTPEYMSPEQLDQEALDHRTDVYSLAVVAYEALTGTLPFPGRTGVEVREQQLSRTPAPPSVMRGELQLSRRMDAALLWGLNQNPANRCTSVADFLTAFEDGYQSTLKGEGGAPRVTAPVPPAPAPAPTPAPRRRPVLLAGGVLIGLVAVICGVVIALKIAPGVTPGPQPDPQVKAQPRAPVKPDSAAAAVARPTPTRVSEAQAVELAQARVLQGLRAAEPETRRTTLELLAHVGRPLLTRQLMAAMADPDLSVRRAAVTTIGALGAKEALPALRKAHRESMGFMAIYLATAMARLGDARGLRYLQAQLKAPKNVYHKKTVLKALGLVGDPAARAWRKFLDQSQVVDTKVRIEAMGYLAALGEQEAIKWLRRAARDKDWTARIDAAVALSAVDQALSRKVLRQAMKAATGPQRARAACILAQIGDTSHLKALIEFAGKQNVDLRTRTQCTLALGYAPQEGTTVALVGALEDQEARVATAAAVALLRQRYNVVKQKQ